MLKVKNNNLSEHLNDYKCVKYEVKNIETIYF